MVAIIGGMVTMVDHENDRESELRFDVYRAAGKRGRFRVSASSTNEQYTITKGPDPIMRDP